MIINPFIREPKFNPKQKDVAAEIYLSRLEEDIFSLGKTLCYSNLTKEEKHVPYSIRDDTSIIVKEADKSSGTVVWDRDYYLADARAQLNPLSGNDAIWCH